LHQRGLILLANDIHAQLDALVANEYGRAGDELAHLVLALAAERAIQRILRVATANLAHPTSPSARDRTANRVRLDRTIARGPLRVRSMNATLSGRLRKRSCYSSSTEIAYSYHTQ